MADQQDKRTEKGSKTGNPAVSAEAATGGDEGNGVGELAPAWLERLEPENPLEALSSLAELEQQTAAAYEVAAESAEEEEIREQLRAFRDDHLRHIGALNKALKKLGGKPVDERVDPSRLLLGRIAGLARPLGSWGALVAMLANEQLTNATYETLLEFDWDEEIADLLEENFDDETRHLDWVIEAEEVFADAAEKAAEQASEGLEDESEAEK